MKLACTCGSAGALLVLSVISPAFAQLPQQVDPRVNTRVDGRLLDASNYVGSGGYNVNSVPEFPNSANLLISGNISAGRQFRGYSPIRDSSQLFLNVPSAALGNFDRDSIGVGDIVAGRSQSYATPFFNSSSTATTVGRVRQDYARELVPAYSRPFVQPGTDALTGRPIQLDPGLNPGWSLPPPVARTYGTADSYRQPDPVISQSPLFGLPRATGYETPQAPAPVLAPVPGTPDLQAPPGPMDPLAGVGTMPRNLFDATFGRGTADRLTQATPTGPTGAMERDLLAAAAAAGTAAAPPPAAEVASLARPIGPGEEVVSAEAPLPRLTPSEVPVASPSEAAAPPGELPEFVPSRRSVYQDFQAARRWLGDDRRPRASRAERVPEPSEETGAYEKSMAAARAMLEQPPKSFAGVEQTPVNERIRRAEDLMRRGDFYASASQYDMAATQDPRNLLIALGKGHALFAAGDYLSAVQSLTRGIERFEGLDQFRINLYEFVPDPNMLDIRRADLENKLERQEDYRLRFLLGYVEYYSGLERFGLPDLQRAAEQAPPGSVIARFPGMLQP